MRQRILADLYGIQQEIVKKEGEIGKIIIVIGRIWYDDRKKKREKRNKKEKDTKQLNVNADV
jgi:hypothetical protein